MADREEEHRKFAASLSENERLLLEIRDELYVGREGERVEERWERMAADLHARLEGRPYIFELAGRIEEDLAGIEKMGAYESEHGIDLADYLEQNVSGGVEEK